MPPLFLPVLPLILKDNYLRRKFFLSLFLLFLFLRYASLLILRVLDFRLSPAVPVFWPSFFMLASNKRFSKQSSPPKHNVRFQFLISSSRGPPSSFSFLGP